jgi:hypothetical protein
MSDHVSHPYKIACKITEFYFHDLYFSIFTKLDYLYLCRAEVTLIFFLVCCCLQRPFSDIHVLGKLELFYCGACIFDTAFSSLVLALRHWHDKHWMKIELPGCIICLQERYGSVPVLLRSSVLIACWVMHYGEFPFSKTKITVVLNHVDGIQHRS